MFRARTLTLALLPAAAGILAAWPPAVATGGAERSTQESAQAVPDHIEQGRRLFEQHWVVAPSAFGQWGRGPLSNAEACTDCHPANGRGRPPQRPDEPLRSGLVRLSVGPADAPQPHPDYGAQLQPQGVLGRVPGEGEAYVEWSEHPLRLADGSVVMLREPRLRFERLALGPVDAGTMTSLRVAPPLFGLGRLDAVPAQALEALALAQRATGMAGRVHGDGARPGRFGHKALEPSLRAQVATALHADIGVTSSLLPVEDCTARERACGAFPVSAYPEISDAQLAALEAYLAALPPPARRGGNDPLTERGEAVFERVGCAVCHAPALPGPDGPVRAYSDLLLHDLGTGLADGRPEGAAGAGEWRTAPLWGLGRALALNEFLLHDGRARNLEEAILWHGGQAQGPREAYRALSPADRAALAAFLSSL